MTSRLSLPDNQSRPRISTATGTFRQLSIVLFDRRWRSVRRMIQRTASPRETAILGKFLSTFPSAVTSGTPSYLASAGNSQP